GLRSIRPRDDAAVSDVGISEFESGLLVVLLLRHHAIQPDHATAGMGDSRVPDTQSVAAAAQIFAVDIETVKGEARAVIDAGDGRGRRTVEFADQETLRIGHGEARSIGE